MATTRSTVSVLHVPTVSNAFLVYHVIGRLQMASSRLVHANHTCFVDPPQDCDPQLRHSIFRVLQNYSIRDRRCAFALIHKQYVYRHHNGCPPQTECCVIGPHVAHFSSPRKIPKLFGFSEEKEKKSFIKNQTYNLGF